MVAQPRRITSARNDMASLDLLLRREGPGPWLTGPERRLVKFAVDTFGAPLAGFLLAGLGEKDETGRAWVFSVTFEDGGGASRRREIRVEAPDLPGSTISLPAGKEPLVLMALLRLLLAKRGAPPSRLSYRREEVLRLLGRDETDESLRAMDEAVERYADLGYRWALSAEELSERNLARFRGWASFVTGCGHRDAEEAGGGAVKRESSYVQFSAEFVRELISRSVFDVKWDNVREMTRKPPPSLRPFFLPHGIAQSRSWT